MLHIDNLVIFFMSSESGRSKECWNRRRKYWRWRPNAALDGLSEHLAGRRLKSFTHSTHWRFDLQYNQRRETVTGAGNHSRCAEHTMGWLELQYTWLWQMFSLSETKPLYLNQTKKIRQGIMVRVLSSFKRQEVSVFTQNPAHKSFDIGKMLFTKPCYVRVFVQYVLTDFHLDCRVLMLIL